MVIIREGQEQYSWKTVFPLAGIRSMLPTKKIVGYLQVFIGSNSWASTHLNAPRAIDSITSRGDNVVFSFANDASYFNVLLKDIKKAEIGVDANNAVKAIRLELNVSKVRVHVWWE